MLSFLQERKDWDGLRTHLAGKAFDGVVIRAHPSFPFAARLPRADELLFYPRLPQRTYSTSRPPA